MKRIAAAGLLALALAGCEEMGGMGGTGGTATPTGADATTPDGGSGGGLSSLINVNLSDIAAEVAKNVNLNLEDVPISVQLPVNVAANVCGVDVNLLSASLNTAGNDCQATTTSSELEQAVRNAM